jgi:hypothetical protein
MEGTILSFALSLQGIKVYTYFYLLTKQNKVTYEVIYTVSVSPITITDHQEAIITSLH